MGIAQKDSKTLLYYYQTKNTQTFFKVAASSNGFEFEEKSKYVFVTDDKQKEEKNFDWKGFRVSQHQDTFILTYLYNGKATQSVIEATSSDLIRFKKTNKIDNITQTASIVSNFQHNGQYVMYFGQKAIQLASSTDLATWQVNETPVLTPRKDMWDDTDLEIGNAYSMNGYIVVIYYVGTKAGAALFASDDPQKLLWRSDKPLWEPPHHLAAEKITPLGLALTHDELILYWLVQDASLFAVSCQIPTVHSSMKEKHFSTLFAKHQDNPIIAPDPKHSWESRATFNSAAVYEDGKVHFVYRALGDKDLSVLGYATSSDGVTIDERSDEPIYIPREPFETPGQHTFKTFADHFASGGGYGGVEDPRITKVNDTFYMTYVAFDGANPPRVALTSISVDDFLNRRWDKWEKPKLISAPGMVNKNAVIFPEKINGKYVVFHRIYPNVLIDYVDDLTFDNSYLTGHHFIPPRKTHWDSKKIGAGAPPIKTKDGWLFIYQSVGYQDPGRYKIGAMVLDHTDPSRVLYRANSPIVEPIENYENDGFKAGVVYPCGAVVVDGTLHVYYGGADTVVCAASAELDQFLWELKHQKEPKLKKVHLALN